MTYAYNKADDLTSFTDGGGTVTYQYADPAGRLSSVTQPDSSQIAFDYDDDGNRDHVSYPNRVVVDRVFDGAGKTTSVIATNGATTLSSLAYSYLDGQQPTSAIQSETDGADSVTRYTYASPGRLVRAQTKNSGGTVTADFQYTYDPAGNRTAQDVNGVQTSYAYNAANQLAQAGSTTYSYDANGSLTGSSAGFGAAYNTAGQATSVTPAGGGAVAMAYRGTGQTDRIQAGSLTERRSSLGVSGTSEATGDRYYTRTPEGELLAQRSASGALYYITDAHESVTGMTDASGALVASYRYDPFGTLTASTGSIANPWRFAGEFLDAPTGLYKIGARYYDPAVGRWTQQDQVLDFSDVRQSNRYAYVGADPINFLDPTGLTSMDKGCLATKSKNGKTGNIMACARGVSPKPIAVAIKQAPRVIATAAVRTYFGVGPYVAACGIGGTFGAYTQASSIPTAAGYRMAAGFAIGCAGGVYAATRR